MRRLRYCTVLLLSLLATAVPAHAAEPIDNACAMASILPGPEDELPECPHGRT